MALSLQKKFFLAFFAIAAILVLLITGAQHKVMRDGFDNYIAHVKVQRLSNIENAVLAYSAKNQGVRGLSDGDTWLNLVMDAEVERNQEREARRQDQEDKQKQNKEKDKPALSIWPDTSTSPANGATLFPNYSKSRTLNELNGPYLNQYGKQTDSARRSLPPFLRGVALLDTDGVLVVGEPIIVEQALRVPIKDVNGQLIAQWLIRKGAPEMDVLGRRFLEEQLEAMFFMLAAAAVFSAVFAWWLAYYFRRPIGHLKDAFRLVSAGRLETRLPVKGRDEVSEIAQHFNLMAGHLGAQEVARKQWMADTSHELRTPLTILRSRMEAMRDGVIPNNDAEWDRNLKVVTDFSVLVNDLQAMARADAGQWDLQNAQVDIKQWLSNAYRDNKALFDAAGLTLQLDIPNEQMSVWGDEQRLQQVLRNVLVNSARYTDAPGFVKLTACRIDDVARVMVEDSSPSVSDEALPHLFERFYRVDASRNRVTGGSGLGLAICESIVNVHRGIIRAEHSDMGGLRVVIDLPLWQPSKPIGKAAKK
jgi:two-component system sensor histidine kinase BaeS